MSSRSFGEAIRLEDQQIPNEEFEIISDAVSSLLNKINKLIVKLEDDLRRPDQLDYQKALNTINTLLLNFKQLNLTKTNLINFDIDNLNQIEVFAKEKLILEINRALQKFNSLQSNFTEIEQKLMEEQQKNLNGNNGKNSDMALIDMEEGSRRTEEQQEQVQEQFQIEYDPINAEELEYQQNLIHERNLEIQNISNSILEINEIYQDLSTMVQEQGMTLDNIENNLYSVVADTKQGRNELVRLNNYQKRKNNRCFWLLIILTAWLLLMVLAAVV